MLIPKSVYIKRPGDIRGIYAIRVSINIKIPQERMAFIIKLTYYFICYYLQNYRLKNATFKIQISIILIVYKYLNRHL